MKCVISFAVNVSCCVALSHSVFVFACALSATVFPSALPCGLCHSRTNIFRKVHPQNRHTQNARTPLLYSNQQQKTASTITCITVSRHLSAHTLSLCMSGVFAVSQHSNSHTRTLCTAGVQLRPQIQRNVGEQLGTLDRTRRSGCAQRAVHCHVRHCAQAPRCSACDERQCVGQVTPCALTMVSIKWSSRGG